MKRYHLQRPHVVRSEHDRTTPFKPVEKHQVIEAARRAALRDMHRYAKAIADYEVCDTPALERCGCLFHAVAVVREFDRFWRVRSVLQAGSMQWPIVRPENDDGCRPTHFSYMWSPNEALSILRLAEGGLPEMHVWAACPDLDGGTIVDPTTLYLKSLVNDAGLPWETPEPPPYLWATAATLPERVRYVPEPDAVLLALDFAARLSPYFQE